jgi:hypothetical protein
VSLANLAGLPAPAASQPHRHPIDEWGRTDAFARELGVKGIEGTQYAECRLGRAQAQVDCLYAVSREAAGRFHEALAAHASAHGRAHDPAWAAVLRVLREWDEGHSPITPTSPGIWLEFDDVGNESVRCVTPSISFGLVQGYRFDRPFNPCALDRDLGAARNALRALGMGWSEDIMSTLIPCYRELPQSGRWVHLSVMLGRKPSAIKLYGAIARAALLPYLRAIGWRGDDQAFSDLLAEAYGPDLLGDEVFIDLNLDNFRDARRCSLGLAVAQQHLFRGPDPDPRRSRVLDRWIALGLADRGRAESISEGLGCREDVFRPDGRFLDLKIVWQADGAPIAKAYLGSHRVGHTL